MTEIRDVFGEGVAGIVAECSDTFESPKPPWKQRKEAYIAHVAAASEGAVLVSLADKLDNARAIVRDLREHGDGLWQRFSVNDPDEHLWYYTSLLELFEDRRPKCWLVAELRRTIEAWCSESAATAGR